MSTVVVPEALAAEAAPRTEGLSALAIASFASIGAGAIHATAIGVHSEHRQAVFAFAFVAAFQLGWGVIVLTNATRVLAVVGLLGNALALGGWVTAKTAGIPFVAGLDETETVQVADSAAAGLALLAVIAASAVALRSSLDGRRRLDAARVPLAIVVTAIAVTGMVSAGSHAHADDDHHADATVSATRTRPPAVVPPTPYDPTKPIDLSGVDGVTPEQQARAENLIAVTLLRLPKYGDPATAEAAGYRSIQDGPTGYEHFINYGYINDDKILDPDFPESLVYRVQAGQRILEAAMYMLPEGQTLDTVPDVGGRLMQWHIHDNLCFTPDAGAPRVAGLTRADGTCTPPLRKGIEVPMIHVWIVSHRCGPFAALEGVGAGAIKANETRLCDHVHGA